VTAQSDTPSGEQLAALCERAATLRAAAEALSRRYERTVWIKFVAVFVPVPFAVLLLRLHLEAWGYYLAGGLFVAVAAAVMAMDWAATAKRDLAVEVAEQAEKACKDARGER
jgi:hypothetical protein